MNATEQERNLDFMRSRHMTIRVCAGDDGRPRIVIEGDVMAASGFRPGDQVEAIIQSGLISILPFD